MPYRADVYRVLISSPSDVTDERKIIEEVIDEWNAHNSARSGVVLLPVHWTTHTVPEMGGSPQAIINRQIVDESDFLVGVFWTRLGTPTDLEQSGSVEEIKRFIDQQKPVGLYFSATPVNTNRIDPEQLAKVNNFKSECEKGGFYVSYNSLEDFRTHVRNHLFSLANARSNSNGSNQAEIAGSAGIDTGFEELLEFTEDFENFRRSFEVDWEAERDSKPANIEGGKDILRDCRANVAELARYTAVGQFKQIETALRSVMKDIAPLQNHRLFADGGRSYRAFWEAGDKILEHLRALSNELKALQSN